MPGYLLDTNHVAALASRKSKIVGKVASLPEDAQLRACVITLGEVEAGHRMTKSSNQAKRDEFTKFVNNEFVPNALGIGASTRFHYADIIGRLWDANPPPKKTVKTERWLVCEWGIDINDVWTVAVALEHGLVLITRDKLTKVRAVMPELKVDNWL